MINIALIGNPNTGKTTLYNLLTSSREHVGNWHGVTVEEKAKSYIYKNMSEAKWTETLACFLNIFILKSIHIVYITQ